MAGQPTNPTIDLGGPRRSLARRHSPPPGVSGGPARQRQIPKESNGSLLTPPEAYVKRTAQVISAVLRWLTWGQMPAQTLVIRPTTANAKWPGCDRGLACLKVP